MFKLRQFYDVLASRSPKFVSREEISSMIWGDRPRPKSAENMVSCLAHRLRKRLEPNVELQTSKHLGYRLMPAGSPEPYSPTEEKLIELLVEGGTQVVGYETIAASLWTGPRPSAWRQIIAVYAHALRQRGFSLATVHGHGLVLLGGEGLPALPPAVLRPHAEAHLMP